MSQIRIRLIFDIFQHSIILGGLENYQSSFFSLKKLKQEVSMRAMWLLESFKGDFGQERAILGVIIEVWFMKRAE